MKYLIVVDMQKDFITGSLGTEEAKAILNDVIAKAENYDGEILFTRDTHTADYLNTQEGRNLPVQHCIKGEEGWQLSDELDEIRKKNNLKVFDKPAFGSVELAENLKAENEKATIEEIELCGLCTDICVISNALLIKAFLPEVPVYVDAKCCAGVTKKSHENALEAMKMCQIHIKNEQ